MTVKMIKHAASDDSVVWAARVSTSGEESLGSVDEDAARSAGLIRYLMKNRHGTPFEHNTMVFYVHAPIFVFREFMRHRVGFSYNEESGRYRELAPCFYVPDPATRKLAQVGKAGAYTFVPGTPVQHAAVLSESSEVYRQTYQAYQNMLDAGVAREVARIVLPVGTYSSMYVTCNARALMHFLSLRTNYPDAAFPSYPQHEIELVARQMEVLWRELMPITHAAFNQHGRVCP